MPPGYTLIDTIKLNEKMRKSGDPDLRTLCYTIELL